MIRRLQPELAKMHGITLFMQPVQDLTVEDRVSRTQYQYTLEDADAQELALVSQSWSISCRALPQLRDVASDQQKRWVTGRHADRSRHRVAPGNSAAGDRRHALRRFRTAPGLHIFTQLNQYHVVLEVDPQFQQNPDSLKQIYVKSIDRQCRYRSRRFTPVAI